MTHNLTTLKHTSNNTLLSYKYRITVCCLQWTSDSKLHN